MLRKQVEEAVDPHRKVDARVLRRKLLESIRSNAPARGLKPSDPAKLVREDRCR